MILNFAENTFCMQKFYILTDLCKICAMLRPSLDAKFMRIWREF